LEHNLKLANHFLSSLSSDKILVNTPRQVLEAAYSIVYPTVPKLPKLLIQNHELVKDLGINLANSDFIKVFSGTNILQNTTPFAMCYGGHQFGHWAGQLGDGRAINLFDIKANNKKHSFQLKGAGPTPYSRNGDGFAVLRSSIREYICAEAMHYLGIASSRSLSLISTGNDVLRDMMYNGNLKNEKGAIVCRVAESFIRFGSFEIFAARNDIANLKKLLDFIIKHFYNYIVENNDKHYYTLFSEICKRTMNLIIDWQRVGFVHGVMNTDNMSILGDTIDYGPYGWIEEFNFSFTPNTTDVEQRYCYGNQASIALWNLTKLANALLPLMPNKEILQAILNETQQNFELGYNEMIFSKLGLSKFRDIRLINDLFALMQNAEIDFTLFFRSLSVFEPNNTSAFINKIADCSYLPESKFNAFKDLFLKWLNDYAAAINTEKELSLTRIAKMNSVNPKYIFRNYMAQLVIDEVENGEENLLHTFIKMLQFPYDEQPENEIWFAKRPDWAKNKIGCDRLSCSS